MNKDSYEYRKSLQSPTYLFISNGVNGQIPKIVSFSKINISKNRPVFNLAFGNLKVSRDKSFIDDQCRSNNGDIAKVLATVARIAIEFMHENPDAVISFCGAMDEKSIRAGRNQRNVIYQRGIDTNWEELNRLFRIWGVWGQYQEEYVRGTCYDEILIENR